MGEQRPSFTSPHRVTKSAGTVVGLVVYKLELNMKFVFVFSSNVPESFSILFFPAFYGKYSVKTEKSLEDMTLSYTYSL